MSNKDVYKQLAETFDALSVFMTAQSETKDPTLAKHGITNSSLDTKIVIEFEE